MLFRQHQPPLPTIAALWRRASASATEALLGYRQSDGHWVFELEADRTIPAEYVLLRHYLGEPVDATLEAKIANYLLPDTGRPWRLAAGA